MNKQELEYVQSRIANSVFYRDRYTVEMEMARLSRSLMMYIKDDLHEDSGVSMSDIFEHGIPVFQRDADKWDRQRQINFVENFISGYRPSIQLYTTDAVKREWGGLARCWILDGLQRLTAIAAFMNDEFKIFDTAYYSDLERGGGILRNGLLHIEIFTFEDDVEAARFYIQLNRGVTHSEADIERALRFIEAKREVNKMSEKIKVLVIWEANPEELTRYVAEMSDDKFDELCVADGNLLGQDDLDEATENAINEISMMVMEMLEDVEEHVSLDIGGIDKIICTGYMM